MADDIDVESRRRHLLILDGKKNARCGEKKNQHNQYGDHRPGQFDLGTAVDLGRFTVVVGIALPVADHHIGQERRHHDKNCACDLNHKKRQMVNHRAPDRSGDRMCSASDGRCCWRELPTQHGPRSSAEAATHKRLARGPFALQPSSRHWCGSSSAQKKTHCSAVHPADRMNSSPAVGTCPGELCNTFDAAETRKTIGRLVHLRK